jgi:hypothetical protein
MVERDPQEIPTPSSQVMAALSVLMIGAASWVMVMRGRRLA